AKRPFGPAGKPWVQHCAAISGASRLATAQALGGFMINAPLPETNHLLFEASSHAAASGGRKVISFFEKSSACRTVSVLTVSLPLASTSSAPKELKIAPAVSTLSVVSPRPMPKGKPALWQDSAAFRNVSIVQLSAFGGPPAGYIACTSMLAYFFIRSIREQGPLIWLPMQAGTPSHLPLAWPRYLTVSFTS